MKCSCSGPKYRKILIAGYAIVWCSMTQDMCHLTVLPRPWNIAKSGQVDLNTKEVRQHSITEEATGSFRSCHTCGKVAAVSPDEEDVSRMREGCGGDKTGLPLGDSAE